LEAGLAAFLSSLYKIPDVEIIWKFCGKRCLTGLFAALYVYQVSRTVGFAFEQIRLD